MPGKMTPAEAFEMLRGRRVREIAQGREMREIPTSQLMDLLRLYGVPIPRFESDDAETKWLDSEAAEAVLSQVAVTQGNGKLPLGADGCP
jgi:hypothetical protein